MSVDREANSANHNELHVSPGVPVSLEERGAVPPKLPVQPAPNKPVEPQKPSPRNDK